MAGLAVAVILGAVALTGGGMGWFSGTKPAELGARNGRLALTKPSPNNVSSQTDPASDPGHYVAPLAMRGEPGPAWTRLLVVLRGWPRTVIVSEASGYLHMETTSRLMGFVDDTEFLADAAAGVIHVRAASRLGESDLGVNRKRVEAIREAYAAAGAGMPVPAPASPTASPTPPGGEAK